MQTDRRSRLLLVLGVIAVLAVVGLVNVSRRHAGLTAAPVIPAPSSSAADPPVCMADRNGNRAGLLNPSMIWQGSSARQFVDEVDFGACVQDRDTDGPRCALDFPWRPEQTAGPVLAGLGVITMRTTLLAHNRTDTILERVIRLRVGASLGQRTLLADAIACGGRQRGGQKVTGALWYPVSPTVTAVVVAVPSGQGVGLLWLRFADGHLTVPDQNRVLATAVTQLRALSG